MPQSTLTRISTSIGIAIGIAYLGWVGTTLFKINGKLEALRNYVDATQQYEKTRRELEGFRSSLEGLVRQLAITNSRIDEIDGQQQGRDSGTAFEELLEEVPEAAATGGERADLAAKEFLDLF